MYSKGDFLPFHTKPDHLETARKIIFEKLRVFIHRVKSDGQPFEIKKDDEPSLRFEVNEIQACLSQMEQELSIVERNSLYYLEWNILVTRADATNGQNYFGQSFNVRKLELIEAIINHCFGNSICQGSFQPTRMPIDNYVPGRVCIEGIAQIIESVQIESKEKKNSSLQADNRWLIFSHTDSKKNDNDPITLDNTLVV